MQSTLGVGLARVEFPHLGVNQIVEEEGAVLGTSASGTSGSDLRSTEGEEGSKPCLCSASSRDTNVHPTSCT